MFFFNLLSFDLIAILEESYLLRNITCVINATFFNLILKNPNSYHFSNYRPISLCNVVYKMISKVISNKIK